MKRRVASLTIVACTLALGACSQSDQPGDTQSPTAEVVTDPASDAAKSPGKDGAIVGRLPQLAYHYALSYRLDGGAIAQTQDRHLQLCRDLGARCQLVAMERSAKDDSFPTASLKLRVATEVAPAFAAQLGQTVTSAGGRALDTNVAADDVSKEIVDTQARIRQRELLGQRMTEILRSRDGKLADLVDTERSVAQAQEELDQARAWLAELKGRVALSDFDIHYEAATAVRSGTLAGQLVESADSSFGAFRNIAGFVLTLAIFLAPWALLGLGGWWAVRTVRRRWIAPTALAVHITHG